MSSLKEIKTGDTFELTYSLPIEFGNSIAQIKSQVVKQSADKKTVTVIQTLTITELADSIDLKNWRLSATAEQTKLWPVDLLVCDVANIASDGKIISTNVFNIPVIKGATVV